MAIQWVSRFMPGQVDQFQYRYYSVTILERLELAIHVAALQGDPDVFVSNEASVALHLACFHPMPIWMRLGRIKIDATAHLSR